MNIEDISTLQFRIPFRSICTNTERNAQTFEGWLFVWDGSGDRRDHGLGFQWVLNPWLTNFGEVRR